MSNIKLNYLYRDAANYKNHGRAIFANASNIGLHEIDKTLRNNLLDGEYFYANHWGLKDLHFEKYDEQDDHPYHEFVAIEFTEEAPTESYSIATLLQRVKKANREWR